MDFRTKYLRWRKRTDKYCNVLEKQQRARIATPEGQLALYRSLAISCDRPIPQSLDRLIARSLHRSLGRIAVRSFDRSLAMIIVLVIIMIMRQACATIIVDSCVVLPTRAHVNWVHNTCSVLSRPDIDWSSTTVMTWL